VLFGRKTATLLLKQATGHWHLKRFAYRPGINECYFHGNTTRQIIVSRFGAREKAGWPWPLCRWHRAR
jgi:hypothetical protein